MGNKVKKINILQVARGAVAEQIEIETDKVIENLADPNTDWKAARTLTIKLTFKNDSEKRDIISMHGQAKATLVANTPIGTMLYSQLTTDGVAVAELNKPDPNQITIEEEQGQATTNVINIRKAGSQNG